MTDINISSLVGHLCSSNISFFLHVGKLNKTVDYKAYSSHEVSRNKSHKNQLQARAELCQAQHKQVALMSSFGLEKDKIL